MIAAFIELLRAKNDLRYLLEKRAPNNKTIPTISIVNERITPVVPVKYMTLGNKYAKYEI